MPAEDVELDARDDDEIPDVRRDQHLPGRGAAAVLVTRQEKGH